MTKKHIFWLPQLVLLLSLASCDRKVDEFRTVSGNIENIDSIEISAGNIVPLETNDSSLIYRIDNLEKAGNWLIVHSSELLKAYDPKTGKYLGIVAKKGEGPGEFNHISQIWVKSDTIRLLDVNTFSLFSYLPDGTFVSRNIAFETQDNPDHAISRPTYLMEIPGNGNYISLNSFTDGTTKSNPTASLYDKNLKYLRDIDGRSLRDGSYISDRMTPDKEGKRLLMWEALIDTLFTITPEGIKPWLAFDFGKNKFPDEYQQKPEMFERIRIFTSDKEAPYISHLHCYQKMGNILFFTASTPNSNSYICRLDLDNDNLKLYKITDPSGKYIQKNYLKIIDGKLYVELADTESEEANPALLVINPDKFE